MKHGSLFSGELKAFWSAPAVAFCSMAHSLNLKEERYAGRAERDGELLQSLHPDGTWNTSCHGSVFSGGFFPPPTLYVGASDLKYLQQYFAVFPVLRLHRGESICRTGPCHQDYIDVKDTAAPLSQFMKAFALPKFKQLKENPQTVGKE